MNDKKQEEKEISFWTILPGVLAGCAAVITSIAVLILALHTAGVIPRPASVPLESPDQRITTMHEEIAFRLHEIRTSLDRAPMTKGVLYRATARIQAHGVGISEEFKDTELRTLLFELEQAIPEENQSSIRNIRDLFEELAKLGPEAPFSEGDLPDPQKVRSARDKFEEIEREWQSYLERSR